jgi:hypothetical protein
MAWQAVQLALKSFSPSAASAKTEFNEKTKITTNASNR